MARRIEFQSIVHDGLAAFISRNNDLNGYWALGQLRNWIEDEGAALLVIPLVDDRFSDQKAQISPLSQRFAKTLQFLMESKNMPSEWIQDARFTIELTAPDCLSCSFRVISDLGRSFEANRILSVQRHDPRRELRRCTART
ncbi:hypothetical protein [Paenirhodobacter populi]|uniref:Uncharacterized protein n=1 Tax=Paenirhodobacter populi TaxID=2306993 RepID=A0A443J9W7_9RHOB|nr:hypothetical protein [Sinirhodobacter populi]RWR04061.1 hypothetical protein D2T32_20870 [Sinirhodobacter populi]RWR17305.1 hypothetical protein D2T30_19340 [Sinirhodobacter populi]